MKIKIVDYQDDWKFQFERERNVIYQLTRHLNPEIVHIGSTAVPGLCAKPTIDIQVGVHTKGNLDEIISPLTSRYTYVKLFEPSWPSRRFFCKYIGADETPVPKIIDVGDVEPVKQGLTSLFNIHVFVKDSDDWIRHLAFRDYLLYHPKERDEYCRLKQKLCMVEYDNIMAYNDAKNDFVKQVQEKSLLWYHDRHK